MKLITSTTFFVLFLAIAVTGQTASPTPRIFSPQTLAELRIIRDEALKTRYAYEKTGFMSNNIGPRLSGSAQAARAVEWVAEEMRQLGLEVRLQELRVPHWVRGIETGELIEFPGMAPGTTQKVVLTALGGSIATPAKGLTAEVVVVDSWDDLERLGREGVTGKVVLFNAKFDRRLAESGFGLQAYAQVVQYRSRGAIEAARLGAVGSLVRSAGASQMRLPHTGGLRYEASVPRIPGAAVTYEDADMIAYLSRIGKVRIRLLLTPQTLPEAISHNVIADLKGSERPGEIVIVSGHLDSWDLGTGALDDACGVAVAMQVPYLLNKLRLRPKRTIRVIAYMNEENGLVGGNEYARAEEAKIIDHFAAIESDLGASRPLGLLFAGDRDALPFFDPILDVLRGHGAGMIRMEGGVGADIDPLTRRGVPSFAPWFDTRSYFKYHHTAADTFDKIDPDDLAKVGSVMAVLAYGLANMEQQLPR
ncbi:MAG TPA: M28 family peptidase [Pyrinomonadaceae bacterium]|nr:M28 family peptidase [Pyrinomonadaceae bacterium]HMP66200.1 M28 family peptidase [Pyrinomonadaceae bacterium]